MSSLLLFNKLPCAEDCDGGGHVSGLLSRAMCLGMVLVTVVSCLLLCDRLPLAKDGAVGGHLPVFLSLAVCLGLVLDFGHNFLIFTGLRKLFSMLSLNLDL